MRTLRWIPLFALLTIQQDPRINTLLEDIKRAVAEIEVLLSSSPSPSPIVTVPVGGNLQAALDSAPVDAEVRVARGTFIGNFRIPRRLTLTTDGLSLHSGRVNVTEDRAQMALLVSPAGGPTLIIASDATISKIAIHGNEAGTSDDVVVCGSASATDRNQQPQNVVFRQAIIGAPNGAKRGISMQCGGVIEDSAIVEIRRKSIDSTGIGSWNSDWPVTIRNSLIEAASENIMLGGSDPRIPGLIPSDWTIVDSTLRKPIEWRGQGFSVKNIIEFKAGRRIIIVRNFLENIWGGEGQSGYFCVITPSQYGTNPEVVVEQLLFENNTVTNAGSGCNILGWTQHTDDPNRHTGTSNRLVFRNNWIKLDRVTYSANAWLMQLGNCPVDLVWENNTIETNGNQFIQGNSCSGATTGFRFTGNIVHTYGAYGTYLRIEGTTHLYGNRWRDYFPGGIIQGNGFVGDRPTFRTNFPDNLHLTTAAGTGLVVDGRGTGALEPYGRR